MYNIGPTKSGGDRLIRKFMIGIAATCVAVVVLFLPTRDFRLGGAEFERYTPPETRQNMVFTTFYSAKKALYRVVLASAEKTFYCGCGFDPESREVDHASCGYEIRKSESRGARVEAEHVVPAVRLCGQTEHWREGAPECVDSKDKPYHGRKCAERYHSVCIRALHDLRNLKPAIGEINQDRSDRSFGEISGDPRLYGRCDFETRGNLAEPAPDIRGDIARIYLFMERAYPELLQLESKEKELYLKWSRLDPVSDRECRWNREITKEQEAPNSVVQEYCDRLSNY